jgi:hypothetical protein
LINPSKAELEEGIKAMESLIRKCENAQKTIAKGTSQWTTLSRRLRAFQLAHRILCDQLAEVKDKEMN